MATSTTDYKQFKIMPGNRKVIKAHVDNLAKSIALHPEILEVRPILVNKNMEVIDGQHRLQACKMLKVPIWYVKSDNLGADEAVIINNNQRNWSILDYARSFAAYGKQAYKDFLEVHEEHPTLPIYTVLRYISGTEAKNIAIKFRNGEFEAQNLKLGKVYLDMIEELTDINRAFGLQAPARALYRVFQIENYDHDRMIKKLSFVPPTMIQLRGTSESVLRNLEDIYNYKQQTDILRFY